MNRYDFTFNLAALLQYMVNEGDMPIVDFVKRSTEEQQRLFKAGLSKCDGVLKVSRHQVGMAADIYLLDESGKLIDWNAAKEKAEKYHNFWVQSGGKPEIPWDKPHFEM